MLTKKQSASGEERSRSSWRLISFRRTVSSKNEMIFSLRAEAGEGGGGMGRGGRRER
jgi:hypothetical protein